MQTRENNLKGPDELHQQVQRKLRTTARACCCRFSFPVSISQTQCPGNVQWDIFVRRSKPARRVDDDSLQVLILNVVVSK